MLIAHIDESGTHDRAKAVCVGGLIAQANAWAKFSKAWSKTLAQAGASSYHAADLESRLGEYKGWTQTKKLAFQKDLIKLVRRATSYGVACGVSLADYDAEVPKEAKRNSPYIACVAGAVIKTVEWAQGLDFRDPITLVFESGGPERGEVSRYFDISRRKYPLIGPLSFGDKSLLPLHGADFYAYEAWKQMENRVVDGELRDMRKSLQAVIDLPFMDAWVFDRAGLATLVAETRAARES